MNTSAADVGRGHEDLETTQSIMALNANFDQKCAWKHRASSGYSSWNRNWHKHGRNSPFRGRWIHTY